jgi:hypothetical protein
MKKETMESLGDFSVSLHKNIKHIIDEQSKKCKDVFSELNTKFDLGLDMSKIKINYRPNDKQMQIFYSNNKTRGPIRNKFFFKIKKHLEAARSVPGFLLTHHLGLRY